MKIDLLYGHYAEADERDVRFYIRRPRAKDKLLYTLARSELYALLDALRKHFDWHQGIFGKYYIEHADGTPVAPRSQYFVLRLDTDPHARAAIAAYADSVQADNPTLAGELRAWIQQINRATESGSR